MRKKKFIKQLLIGAGVGFIVALLNYVIGVFMLRTIGMQFHPYMWVIMKVINCYGSGGEYCFVLYVYAILLSIPIFMLIGAVLAALWWYKDE